MALITVNPGSFLLVSFINRPLAALVPLRSLASGEGLIGSFPTEISPNEADSRGYLVVDLCLFLGFFASHDIVGRSPGHIEVLPSGGLVQRVGLSLAPPLRSYGNSSSFLRGLALLG